MVKNTTKKSLGDRGQYVIATLEGAFFLVKIHDGNNTVSLSQWIDDASGRRGADLLLGKLIYVLDAVRTHIGNYVPQEEGE